MVYRVPSKRREASDRGYIECPLKEGKPGIEARSRLASMVYRVPSKRREASD